jgi:hypothetical protein
MISDFILKLISNPNFTGQPISMIEQQISNFVEQNKQQMSAVIASQKFYPGLEVTRPPKNSFKTYAFTSHNRSSTKPNR